MARETVAEETNRKRFTNTAESCTRFSSFTSEDERDGDGKEEGDEEDEDDEDDE